MFPRLSLTLNTLVILNIKIIKVLLQISNYGLRISALEVFHSSSKYAILTTFTGNLLLMLKLLFYGNCMPPLVSRLIFFVLITSLHSFNSHAQTAQQIEQFKRLPKAQQETLARQMGVDLSQISALTGSSPTSNNEGQQNNQVYPRGTMFDEFGNPVNGADNFENQKKTEQDEELKLYGKDLFANAPSTFSPMSDVPVPANYIIGPGDELVLQLYGKENEEYRIKVGRDGNIVVPKLGPIAIATKSFSETKSYITEQIQKQMIGVEVSLTMGELRSIRVFVMGEAYKPGSYSVSSLSTITHALFVSGGVSDIASLRNIQLKRAGKLVETLDLYDLLNSGDTRKDLLLQDGDAVFIPAVENTVTVDGQVRRPAIYELKGDESLSDVLKLAGGALANGYEQAISIKRFTDGKQIQLTIDQASQNLPILNGDHIVIPQVSAFISDSVSVIGAVARPGKYQWHKNLKIDSLLGDPQRDLLETADLTYVLVLRENKKQQDLEVLQVDLTQTDAQQNLLLQRNDKILVFSKVESEVLGDIKLDDLAYIVSELKEKEKDRWQARIEEKLFWQSVGLEQSNTNQKQFDEEQLDIQSQSIIELSEAEREKVLEFKDSTYFSRKRMLSPVIAKLREQARYGEPLKLIEVAGEVKVPGIYPLSKNASVTELIKAAGGLTEASYSQKSEITRTRINSNGSAEVEHIEFKPFEVIRNDGTNKLYLESKDRVNIFSVPSWQDELSVVVKGEVEFPGEYTIRRGETLADLVKRVGGLTEFGDPNSVIFTRETLREQERKNLRKLGEELRKQIASQSLRRQSGAGSIVSYDEARKLLRDLTSTEAVGRLVIDLNKIIQGKGISNVILEDGDALYVQVRSQSVNVIGEVYVPTSHLYTADQSYESYISKSGGYRALADTKRTYIIRANGSVSIPSNNDGFWFTNEQENIGIMPGDTVVVPFNSDKVDNMTLWTNATQILYQLAISVAAIGSL
ncbi:MAG: polysaccharide export outer membrane protein [Psychroserpens sp.]|jgi:polysaccharide export outer membrane protein